MDTFWHDVRYGFRMLARKPGFTVVAILTLALGAGRGDVIWMVLRQGLTLAGVGIAMGLVGAFATTRLLGSLLFGVKPKDPATLLVVSVAMASVAVLACVIPAFRAMQVNPVIALRYE